MKFIDNSASFYIMNYDFARQWNISVRCLQNRPFLYKQVFSYRCRFITDACFHFTCLVIYSKGNRKRSIICLLELFFLHFVGFRMLQSCWSSYIGPHFIVHV